MLQGIVEPRITENNEREDSHDEMVTHKENPMKNMMKEMSRKLFSCC